MQFLVDIFLRLSWRSKLGTRMKYRFKKLGYAYKSFGWSIKIYTTSQSFLDKKWKVLTTISWPCLKGLKQNIAGCADPFLLVHLNKLYVFFEVIVNDKGELWAAEIQNNRVINPMPVIQEQFHLSFPYVFQSQNDFYMIPESNKDHSVRLYIAEEFPYKWKLKCILASEKNYVDTNFVEKEGVFYWFTYDLKIKKTRLFYSFSLEGSWIEHSSSPFHSNRNAGNFISYKNQLLRPIQVSESTYGEGVDLMRIINLSIHEFSEEQWISPFLKKNNGFSLDGTHHIAITSFNQNAVIAVDGKNRNYYKSYQK